MCVCVHEWECMRPDSAETRLGGADLNLAWHAHRHMHTHALRCDSTNYLQHISFPQNTGHIFSLFLVNASLSEGSLHIFLREKGNNISSTTANLPICQSSCLNILTQILVHLQYPLMFSHTNASLMHDKLVGVSVTHFVDVV